MRGLCVALVTVASASLADEARGLEWQVPASWAVERPRPVRAASYSVPRADGDAEGPECAVFSFAPGLGGDVEQNVQLWTQQFTDDVWQSAPTHVLTGQVAVTYVELDGTMRFGSSRGFVLRPAWKLLGAVVESPRGRLFFKLVGPKRSVEAAREAFRRMVDGSRG